MSNEQAAGDQAAPVLEARSITKLYKLRGRGRQKIVRAVDDVSVALIPGKVTAVVGESGSGKSTFARVLGRLVKPTGGRILLNGVEISRRGVKAYRKDVQLVFQDPFSSLNGVHDIRYHLERPLINYGRAKRGPDLDRAIEELLATVKLDSQFASKLPHELSGGQRQRVAIARALASAPKVLLADEPVSMLDVSIRLGILNLLGELRDRDGLAILYVTHDIASARYFADTVVVMYAGQVIESGPAMEVTDHPAHPYTQLLIASAPDPERTTAVEVSAASSGAASAAGAATGCRFRNRCPFAMEICKDQPPRFEVSPGHDAACWLHDENVESPALTATTAA